MNRIPAFLLSVILGTPLLAHGQTKTVDLPVSKAELGTFPYLKTLPNFKPRNQSDSITLGQNKVYLYDGKQYFAVEGKVSKQLLTIKDNKDVNYSTFQLISEYNKVITTLGGKKIYEGKLPLIPLKTFAGTDDLVQLASAGQVVSGAFQGIVEYAIKTPEKEVWVQLQPYSIGSEYYGLLIVEKENKLINGNINKENSILKDLEKSGAATTHFTFELDKDALLSESKDEILNLVGVYQKHADWKLQLECHSAPLGDPAYTLDLTQKRAAAIRKELTALGVNSANIEIKGLGDQKPIIPNTTETARIKNTRIEVKRF